MRQHRILYRIIIKIRNTDESSSLLITYFVVLSINKALNFNRFTIHLWSPFDPHLDDPLLGCYSTLDSRYYLLEAVSKFSDKSSLTKHVPKNKLHILIIVIINEL